MNPANAKDVRFIKLGRKGQWEKDCIEKSAGTIRLGLNNPYHEACLAGDRATFSKFMHTKKKLTKSKATEITNQVRDFYTLNQESIWTSDANDNPVNRGTESDGCHRQNSVFC